MLRFIDKVTDVLMTYSAYMLELECWKHEDLDVAWNRSVSFTLI